MVSLGSAVGLGNIWKFPYMTGTGGGGAFLVLYLFFVFMVAVPIMISEFVIGRRSRMNAVGAFRKLDNDPRSPWAGIGFMGALAAYLIMFFYSCVAGWVYYYTFKAATGVFAGITADKAGAMFGSAIGAGTAGGSFFSAAVLSPIFWQVLVLCVIGAIISLGVSSGIERAIRIMMPILFILLIICAIRALTLPGAAEGLRFLFHVDSHRLFSSGTLAAMGLPSLSLWNGNDDNIRSYFTADSDLRRLLKMFLYRHAFRCSLDLPYSRRYSPSASNHVGAGAPARSRHLLPAARQRRFTLPAHSLLAVPLLFHCKVRMFH